MQVNNLTKKTILARDLKVVKSFVDKSLGLLKKNSPKSLLFKTRFGVHTFFLKEEIDIVVLGKLSQVVKAKTVKPNSLFFYNPINLTILELPKGTIKISKTAVGDLIEIKA